MQSHWLPMCHYWLPMCDIGYQCAISVTNVPLWVTKVPLWVTNEPRWVTNVPHLVTKVPHWLPMCHKKVTNVPFHLALSLSLSLSHSRSQSLRSFRPAVGIESSGSNHFEITKEITEFCPSGLTQSASMAHAWNGCSQSSRFLQQARRIVGSNVSLVFFFPVCMTDYNHYFPPPSPSPLL